MTIFWSALGSSRRAPPPHPPGNVLAKKALFSTHFAQNSTLFGVVGKGSLVLLISLERPQHFWPTLQSCLFSHFHRDHNAPCLPPKFYIIIIFKFSWTLQPSQEKSKTIVMNFFFFFGGGGGGWEGKQGALWSWWKWWLMLKRANYVTPAKIPTIIYLLFYTKAGNPWKANQNSDIICHFKTYLISSSPSINCAISSATKDTSYTLIVCDSCRAARKYCLAWVEPCAVGGSGIFNSAIMVRLTFSHVWRLSPSWRCNSMIAYETLESFRFEYEM